MMLDFIKNQNNIDVNYDLVITDIKLPEMNGIELVKIPILHGTCIKYDF